MKKLMTLGMTFVIGASIFTGTEEFESAKKTEDIIIEANIDTNIDAGDKENVFQYSKNEDEQDKEDIDKENIDMEQFNKGNLSTEALATENLNDNKPNNEIGDKESQCNSADRLDKIEKLYEQVDPYSDYEIIPYEQLDIVDESMAVTEFAYKYSNENPANNDMSNIDVSETLMGDSEINSVYSESLKALEVNEYSCVVKGIDVSTWQGDIDWAKVKAAGVKFAIIKCAGRSTGADGKMYVDRRFEQNMQGALSNGIQVGVYFFSQAITVKEAQEEASYTLNLIQNYKITYPIAFDWETGEGFRVVKDIYVTKDTLTKITEKYCTMIKNAGYQPMIYGNAWDLSRMDINGLAKKYKVWLARYWSEYQDTDKYYTAGSPTPGNTASDGYVNYPYQMWQYKSTGKVSGITANTVDINVGFFSYQGSGVPSKALKLNITNAQMVYTKGSTINIMPGVKAYNTTGSDVTGQVQWAITDAGGNAVTKDYCKENKGTYTVTYSIVDFTGASMVKTAKLIIREKPTLKLANTSIYSFVKSSKSEISDKDLVTRVVKLLETNVTTAKDCDGKNIMANLTVEYKSGMFAVDSKGKIVKDFESAKTSGVRLVDGSYNIKYTLKDKYGITSTATANLYIIDTIQNYMEYELKKTAQPGFNDLIDIIANANTTMNSSRMVIEYNDALKNAISTGDFKIDEVYEIKYVISAIDKTKYYNICVINIFSNENLEGGLICPAD